MYSHNIQHTFPRSSKALAQHSINDTHTHLMVSTRKSFNDFQNHLLCVVFFVFFFVGLCTIGTILLCWPGGAASGQSVNRAKDDDDDGKRFCLCFACERWRHEAAAERRAWTNKTENGHFFLSVRMARTAVIDLCARVYQFPDKSRELGTPERSKPPNSINFTSSFS